MLQVETSIPVPAVHHTLVSGWVRTSLLDYPGKVASTLFLAGCNYRCPYCHNPELIHPSRENPGPLFRTEEIYEYLSRYAGMLEGVCITGGEPLLEPGLAAVCRRVKQLGLQVKLDTNGSMPHGLRELLDEKLLDYAAVDIKGPPGKIQYIARAAVREERIVADTEATVDCLKASGIPFELRTTVVPGLLEPHDLEAIGRWMRGAPRYVLQQFRPGKTLDPLFEDLMPHPSDHLRELCHDLTLAGYFAECSVRGVD